MNRWLVAVMVAVSAEAVAPAQPLVLANELLRVSIGSAGITEIMSVVHNMSYGIQGDSFGIELENEILTPENGLSFESAMQGNSNVTMVYKVGQSEGQLIVVFTLEPGWPVVSKQLLLYVSVATVNKVELLGQLGLNVSATKILPDGSKCGCQWATKYGKPESLNHAAAFHRCDTPMAPTHLRSEGLMVTVTNPFGQLKSEAPGVRLTAGYGNVGIVISPAAPVFISDHVLIGTYRLSDGWVRPHTLSGVDRTATPPAMLNTAERDIFAAAVEAFLLPSPYDDVQTVKVGLCVGLGVRGSCGGRAIVRASVSMVSWFLYVLAQLSP
jgi:hypothetical protein